MSSKKTMHVVPIMVGNHLARHAFLTLCLPFHCRYKLQYGLKDRSSKTVNIVERGPQKYDIKRKSVPNNYGKSQP